MCAVKLVRNTVGILNVLTENIEAPRNTVGILNVLTENIEAPRHLAIKTHFVFHQCVYVFMHL